MTCNLTQKPTTVTTTVLAPLSSGILSLMKPSPSQSAPSRELASPILVFTHKPVVKIRKRVRKACDRCRVKNTKCDWSSLCLRGETYNSHQIARKQLKTPLSQVTKLIAVTRIEIYIMKEYAFCTQHSTP